ncbi:hypothetical protein QBC40DRAFT_265374 [Triangularia verruculosa]|uniref:Uncharacterized protein n=1 Tax=Triangularia verruculosa TaxID=2587418 RepID=A0AAN6XGX2_9PEZI|nr:hypothetical protein QBC40DRAFT_265374 [Triangularia verruculosa]
MRSPQQKQENGQASGVPEDGEFFSPEGPCWLAKFLDKIKRVARLPGYLRMVGFLTGGSLVARLILAF